MNESKMLQLSRALSQNYVYCSAGWWMRLRHYNCHDNYHRMKCIAVCEDDWEYDVAIVTIIITEWNVVQCAMMNDSKMLQLSRQLSQNEMYCSAWWWMRLRCCNCHDNYHRMNCIDVCDEWEEDVAIVTIIITEWSVVQCAMMNESKMLLLSRYLSQNEVYCSMWWWIRVRCYNCHDNSHRMKCSAVCVDEWE